MEFVLQDGFHDEHDSAWAVFSQHYHCPVCLGCMVETLENSQLLCIQKTPAITELLRLLTYQSSDVLQLFIQEEQVVWHLAEILLGLIQTQFNIFISPQKALFSFLQSFQKYFSSYKARGMGLYVLFIALFF